MTLQDLYDIARLFSSHKMIFYIARISDNVILARLDSINYHIDLNKNAPQIYIANDYIKEKNYNAPFDISLQKYGSKATLKNVSVDSMNKILILECESKNRYKTLGFRIYFEFITRNTNVIITQANSGERVISALRFYENASRNISPNAIFTPLKQPSFTKTLKVNDIESVKEKLLQNYTDMQNDLVKTKQKILCNALESKIKKLDSILKSLPLLDTLEKQKDENLYLANYILMNLDSIPKYATTLEIDNKIYKIPQDSKPSYVSDKLFKIAKKLKQKAQNINIQKQNLESKIEFLHNQLEFAKSANLQELQILQQKKIKGKKEQKKQYESFYINTYRISMGRNASENIRLLKDSKAEFLWLHILNMPSSHMIIHANKVDSNTLEMAGKLLAKLNGKSGKIVIDYTKRKFVKVTNGSNVIYSKESKLHLNI